MYTLLACTSHTLDKREGELTWPGEGVGTAKSCLSSSTDGSPNLEITMACMLKFFFVFVS
jgi:hypothetical protein